MFVDSGFAMAHNLFLHNIGTGEHGVGIGKREYLYSELGEGTVELMRSIKKTIDPLNLFNPGKVSQSTGECIAELTRALICVTIAVPRQEHEKFTQTLNTRAGQDSLLGVRQSMLYLIKLCICMTLSYHKFWPVSAR